MIRHRLSSLADILRPAAVFVSPFSSYRTFCLLIADTKWPVYFCGLIPRGRTHVKTFGVLCASVRLLLASDIGDAYIRVFPVG